MMEFLEYREFIEEMNNIWDEAEKSYYQVNGRHSKDAEELLEWVHDSLQSDTFNDDLPY